MNANDLRKTYISYFVSQEHAEISGKSLIPENDPTVLFTTAGMHPLVPYLLGQPHPAGKRLVDVQKCIRTQDIDSVGDPSHLTFFEMLGNWSLGDYFKEESLRMSYRFLTEFLNIDMKTLSVTIFAGDDEVPRDEVSEKIWLELGIPASHIYALGREDNWWGPAGKTGPCGPDSEMFIDTGIDPCGPDCRPGCSCGKYFEIWNNVFMEYDKKGEGLFEKMEHPCVDTGMGVERTITMMTGKKSVYDTEFFQPLIEELSRLTGMNYGENEEIDMSFRIVCDHVKASSFILGDDQGVKPSNVGQGYILRRLIRRSVRHGRKLGLEENFLGKLAEVVFGMYAEAYPEIQARKDFILEEFRIEEDQFRKTLKKGEHEFQKMLPNLQKNPKMIIPGRLAFRLYDTFGFPVEITEELASENGMTVDREGFDEAFQKHQEKSRMGSEKVFKGGLADDSTMSTRYHSATHLLNEALRRVLGDHVAQKGSNITSERLRFDFSHPDKMTPEQIQAVEALVNEQIRKNLPVVCETMTLEEARNKGAQAVFTGKYDEQVKVYSMGDFAVEVCGGPHVEHLGELGSFKIKKEQSSSRGVRRIRAVLE